MRERITWSPKALKDMARLDTDLRQRIFLAVERLGLTGQGDIKRLRGTAIGQYRLRIGGWRVLFDKVEGENSQILVHRVRPRGQAYKS